MARWITVSRGKFPIKHVKDGRREFPTIDHFIEWHDNHGWRNKDWRFVNRHFRYASRLVRRYN